MSNSASYLGAFSFHEEELADSVVIGRPCVRRDVDVLRQPLFVSGAYFRYQSLFQNQKSAVGGMS